MPFIHITKSCINIKNFVSSKKVYLNFFNVEIYSLINSSLYSIVFRLLYLSFTFFLLFLIDLNSYTCMVSDITGFNSFNFLYILKLVIFYFTFYSIIILLLSRCVFFYYPNVFNNLLNKLNTISLFIYIQSTFLFLKAKNFIYILGLPPSEFEKYLKYEKK